MKILVTGGSGFLGSHIADELTVRGHMYQYLIIVYQNIYMIIKI